MKCISDGRYPKEDRFKSKLTGDHKRDWASDYICDFLLFFLDAYYIKKNKEHEFELYRLEVDELEMKKRISDITGEVLPDFVLKRKITKPSNQISLPILYYVIILVLDVLTKVLMIY